MGMSARVAANLGVPGSDEDEDPDEDKPKPVNMDRVKSSRFFKKGTGSSSRPSQAGERSAGGSPEHAA